MAPPSSVTSNGFASGGRWQTISVCMMVKNEEEFLPRCLSSIKSLADEIIVVDTGSTDKTIGIAERFGCRVHKFPWSGDFSAARNESLKYAQCDWVFIIDADEELAPGETDKVRFFINRPDAELLSISVYNKSLETGVVSSFLPSIRLFRRSLNLRYFGIVHNRLHLPDGASVARSDVSLFHYGYDLSPEKLSQKIARSRALLEQQLEQTPDDIYANFNLAQLLRGLPTAGTAEVAKQIIEHAGQVVRHPEAQGTKFRGQRLMALHQMASAHVALKEYTEAAEYCRRAICEKPNYIDALFTQAHIYALTGKWEEAHASYLSYIKTATSYRADNETDNIILLYLSHQHLAWYSLGVIEEQRQNFNEALRCYIKTLELRQPFMDTYCRAGMIHLNLQDLPRAKEMFLRETEKDSLSATAWFGLGVTAELDGNETQAVAYFHRAVSREPQNPDIRLRLAQAEFSLGNGDKGMIQLQEVVKLAPTNRNLLFASANIAYEGGKFKDAAEWYEAILKIIPTDTEARNNLANCFFSLEKHSAAIKEYEEILRRSPGYHLSIRNLGIAYYRKGEPLKAAILLEKYVAYTHEDLSALAFLGDIFTEINRPNGARECYEQYLKHNPIDCLILFKLSELYLAQGFIESGIKGLEQVVRINPSFEQATARLNELSRSHVLV